MKKKDVSLFELWDKSSKARKISSTSTPTALSVEVESNLQLVLVQTHDEAPQPDRERVPPTPIVEDDEAVDEDEVDLAALERDPGKRLPISSYHANDQVELEGDALTWVLVNQRIISLRSEILVDIPVAFALLGLRIISGLSTV